MKAFLVVLGLATICSGASIQSVKSDLTDTLARICALSIFEGIKVSRGPVLPTLPDPYNLENTYISLPDGNFAGEIAICDSVVTGLFKVSDDLSFRLTIPTKVLYALQAPAIHLEGQHDLDLSLMNGMLRLQSSGDYTLDLTDGKVNLDLKVIIYVNGRFDVTAAALDVSFGQLALNSTEAFANGAPLNWAEFNAGIKELFDAIWKDMKPKIDAQFLETAKEVLKYCNIYTLADGDYSCIGPIGGKSMKEMRMEETMTLMNPTALTCPAKPTLPPHDGSYLIYSENVTEWGIWGAEVDKCPEGSFANGFQLKTEPFMGARDDTALNAVRLFCEGTAESVTSREGVWGSWGKAFFCENEGRIKGFQLRSEEGGKADDTAANNLRVVCPSGSIDGDGLEFGSWRGIHTCVDNFAVCGIKTQVEPDQGPLIDDTSLNNIAFLCCPVA
jgi:hypothetical protein